MSSINVQMIDDSLATTSTPLCPVNALNPIVLRLIFEALVPPSQFLDSSLCGGPDSPFSLAIQASELLTRVCKRWREPALALLYGEITLRSVGQLVALCRTLKTNPNDYAHLTWNIDFAFYTPDHLNTATRKAIAFVLNTCPNIRYLSFSSTFIDRPTDDPLPSLSPPEDALVGAIQSISSQIISFKYADTENSAASLVVPHPLITAFSTDLISLTLSVPTAVYGHIGDSEIQSLIELPPITFLRLKELILWYHDIKGDFSSLTDAWSFPDIIRLSLRGLPSRGRPLHRLAHWFKKVGRGIKYLELASFYTSAPKSQGYILDHFPCLEQLVIPSTFVIEGGALEDWFRSKKYLERNIRIDIWSSGLMMLDTQVSPSELHLRGEEVNGTFKNIRLIDAGLHIPDLPSILPPSPEGLAQPVHVHRMQGLCIVETSWCLFRAKADWNNDWDGRYESLDETSKRSDRRSGMPFRCEIWGGCFCDCETDEGSDYEPEDEANKDGSDSGLSSDEDDSILEDEDEHIIDAELETPEDDTFDIFSD